MSRLDRALEKARAESGQHEDTGSGTPDGSAPMSEFTSSWDFDEVPAARDRPRTSRPTGRAAVAEPVPPRATAPDRHSVEPAAQFEDFNAETREKLVVGTTDASLELREQFRKIAASLYRLREVRPLKVVMVVSAVPGEGKTLSSVNLALTLSESYASRVLLLDADLRRPTVHQVFNLPNTVGLREELSFTSGSVVAPVSISGYLDVLTAGTAAIDPMNALTSDRMRSILAHSAERYDWVLIDTPPVELLSDARLLASEADGAILVVRAGSTPYLLAQRAIAAIGAERVLGVILNNVTADMGAGAYRHYGYYGEPHTGGAKR